MGDTARWHEVKEASAQGHELVFEQALGVVEQPPDEGRLAVVDAAAGQEAELALLRVGDQHRRQRLAFLDARHQK